MLLLIGSFLFLLILGTPVAVSMAVASLAYLVIYGVAPDIIAAQRMIAGVESFPLIAVPFFILAGNLMNIAGVTGRIYKFALSLVGWMKGGLAQVNIIGSVIPSISLRCSNAFTFGFEPPKRTMAPEGGC